MAQTANLEQHLQMFWPNCQIRSFEWTLGPIKRSLPGFHVLRIDPSRTGQPWIYVSDGAATVEAANGERFEFAILGPAENPAHVETLAMTANLHSDPRYRLKVGDVLNIGRPWVDGSSLTHLLVSLPYPYGPTLEHFKVDNFDVRLLWLLPISAEEANFARTHGVEALEQRFDESAIDYLDVQRTSVV